nr:signal peptidase I [uncultured Ruminococcus sp.]
MSDSKTQPTQADTALPEKETDVLTAEITPDKTEQDAEKKAPNKKQTKKKKTTAQLLIGFLIKLAVIALAVWMLFTFVLGLVIHYGNNMHPAIRDGDLIISLRVQRPYLNAAVLYEHDGKMCLGRVVGMPGNTIDISDEGALTVNGTAPAEEVFYPTHRCDTSDISYPYTVGEDQVFILNDFRSDTSDSRMFGAVSMKDVKGPVLLMLRRRSF